LGSEVVKGRRLIARAICAAVFLLTLACVAHANDPVPVVTTTDGRTFKEVRVFRTIGDKVLLIHTEGTDTVPLDALPDEARKSLGLMTRAEKAAYDAEQAKKGLVKSGDDWVTPQEKQRREDEKARREEEKKRREEEKKRLDAEAEADAKAQDVVDSRSLRGVSYRVDQATARGSLCHNLFSGEPFFLYGATNKIVVDDVLLKGDLFWAGNYTYTSVMGAERTVKSYAVDRDAAIKLVKAKFNLVPNSPPSTKSAGLDNARAFGTGFAITEDGYIITAYHVISDAKSVRVKTETDVLVAKVVGFDKDNDLALLKVNKKTEFVVFASSRTANLGQTVFTVGFPMPNLQGFSPKVTKGVISGLKGINDDVRKYQIDASVQPGNSGGPLADESGNVVGVVVARISDAAVMREEGVVPQNVNYSLKLSYVLAVVDAYPEVARKIHVAEDNSKVSFEEAVEKVRKATVIIASY
jgi:S1-C subfamily serine protease